jgi:thioredoxin reductase (NADPH)
MSWMLSTLPLHNGRCVSDVHQLSVAFGHAALAATAIHNELPFNPR